jgi:hypothetical protein
VPKEDDSWARAPALEIRPLVSAEVKRRTTAGGGSLLDSHLEGGVNRAKAKFTNINTNYKSG